MKPLNVSACIATRSDIDIEPILDSLPEKWERVVWNNGFEEVWMQTQHDGGWTFKPVANLGPYGRFAAIEYATHDLIYVQDDDVIVSDPQAIVDELKVFDGITGSMRARRQEDWVNSPVVCNMPPEFRPHYPDSAMVGFGAAFQRDLPKKAFDRFFEFHDWMKHDDPMFLRESCRIFTTMTPRVLVDIPKTDMSYASNPDRLWKQPDHIHMRETALTLARQVRDAR